MIPRRPMQPPLREDEERYGLAAAAPQALQQSMQPQTYAQPEPQVVAVSPTRWEPEEVPAEWSPGFLDFLGAAGKGIAGQSYEPPGRRMAYDARQAAQARNVAGKQRAQEQQISFDRWMRSQGETERHNKAMESRPGSMPFIAGLSQDPSDPESQRADALARQFGYEGAPLSAYDAHVWKSGINQQASIKASAQGRQESLKNTLTAQNHSFELGQRGADADVTRDIAGEQRSLDIADEKATRESAREMQKAQQLRIPGLAVQDPEAWGMAMRDPAQRSAAYQSASAYSIIQRGMDKLVKLREQNGIEMFAGQNLGDYEATRTGIVAGLTTLFQTGVLNGTEYARYKEMLPSVDPKLSDAGMMIGYDATLAQLEGVRSALSDTLSAGTAKWGAAIDRGQGSRGDSLGVTRGAGPKVDRVVRPPAKPKAAPARNFDDDDLGVVYE